MMKTYYFGNKQSKNILIQMVDDHDLSCLEQEVSYIQERIQSRDFLLIAIQVESWNEDLSPWIAPPVFGNEGFGEGAQKTLTYLELNIIKPLLEEDKERRFFIGGYSLSGLFALWASYQVDYFYGVAAVSPSVWFEGFVEFVKSNVIQTSMVYLSLGDKEEKTRNQRMAQVGEAIRTIYKHLSNEKLCILEWNLGNHFKEPDVRMAKGLSWLLEKENEEHG